MQNKPLLLTLCTRCARTYQNMPDRRVKRADRTQRIKERCDLCRTRMGYDYIISEKRKKGAR